MSNSDNIDVILNAQNTNDDLFAQSSYLKQQIEQITMAKSLAGRGMPEIEDIKNLTNCIFANRYIPFIGTAHQYTAVGASNKANFGSNLDVELRSAGSKFTGDTAIIFHIASVGDVNGSIYYRWTRKPGMRLVSEAKFQINGQTKDKLTYQNMEEIYSHEMDDVQQKLYDRCVGQEEFINAKYFDEDSQVTRATTVSFGGQTYKNYRPKMVIIVPLWFFFCVNPATPINNDQLSDKNRNIQLTLCDIKDIFHALDSTGSPITLPDNVPSIVKANAITRNIWVDDSVRELFNHPGKTLIRSWGFQEYTKKVSGSDSANLSALKFPIERIYFRFVPEVNIDSTNANYRNFVFDNWDNPQFLTQRAVIVPHFQGLPPTLVARNSIFYDEQEPITELNLQLNQTSYFGSSVSPGILDSYLAIIMGKESRISKKKGCYVIAFDHNPQNITSPTGGGFVDFTILNNKEITWSSNLISPVNPVRLWVTTRYLNMIWAKGDGNMEFRYTSS